MTATRLEMLADLKRKENVLYGFAFNLSRCEGYMDCVDVCIKENNLDRKEERQYVRIFEMEHGQMSIESGNGKYFHEVLVEDRFYMARCASTARIRPASRPARPRRPGKRTTASLSSTTTGA